MTDHRPRRVTFPQSERDKLVAIANDHELGMLGMDGYAAMQYAKRVTSEVNVVIAIYPDPDALAEHGGLSFAVIKGFHLFEEVSGTRTRLEIVALAFGDEQQVIAAEKIFGDKRPLN